MDFFNREKSAPSGSGAMGVATIEEHAKAKGTPDWLLASTKAYHGWASGKELSAAEYEAAVDVAENCSTASLKDADGNDTSGAL